MHEFRIRDHCQQSQHLGNAPRLGATSTRRVGRFRVKDLADTADARADQMLSETQSHRLQFVELVGINATPSVDKWSDQPRPDGTLVIRKISRPYIPEIS